MSRLTVSSITHGPGRSDARLVLPFEMRQKSRLLARLEDGDEIGLTLPRGTVLRGGDRLQASDGRIIAVVSAPEEVSVVSTADARQLARAAYHLGNRHVPVQVGNGSICYLRDHVLDDMLLGLGLAVVGHLLPFEPEAGAYSPSQGHGHDHGHGHGHGHTHGNGDAPDQSHANRHREGQIDGEIHGHTPGAHARGHGH